MGPDKESPCRIVVLSVGLLLLVSFSLIAGCGGNSGNANMLSFPNTTKSVIVPDSGNNRVLIYNPPFTSGQSANVVLGQADFTTSTSNTTATTMSIPQAVSLDQKGNLYVADYNNCRILQFQPPFTNGMAASLVLGEPDATTSCTSISPTATTIYLSSGVATDANGNVWVTDSENDRIVEYVAPLSTGMTATLVLGAATLTSPSSCTTTQSGLCFPLGLTFDSTGNLWVADRDNNRVLEFVPPFSDNMTATLELGQPSGTAFTSSTANNGGITASTLDRPTATIFDGSGNLWVADESNNRVLEFVPPFSTGMAATAVVGQPDFTHNTVNQGLTPLTATTLSSPQGLQFDGGGQLFIGDTGNNRTISYSPFNDAQDTPIVLGQTNFTDSAPNQGASASATSQASPFSAGPSVIALLVLAGLVTLWFVFFRRKQDPENMPTA